jgi:hypothetical protein
MGAIFDINWAELFTPTLSLAEAVLRGSLLFLAILALFRIIPNRLITLPLGRSRLVLRSF